MKRGFTIIELLVVVTILGILMGIVTTAAASAIKQARSQKATALCTCVQQGLATYYAQKDQWPGSVGSTLSGGGTVNAGNNSEGVNNNNDYDKYVLSASEVRESVLELVKEAKKGNPLMDISGLYVSRDPGEAGGKAVGLDFMDAIHGTSHSRRKMSTSEMYFGYPESSHGYFRRFKITYVAAADEMKVGQQ